MDGASLSIDGLSLSLPVIMDTFNTDIFGESQEEDIWFQPPQIWMSDRGAFSAALLPHL